ncbi:hypothetical protein [Spiroplasma endosymbiont of Agriotes lineatus]|uniref:hypothetical protein n=1 Tax=Spiroplasma endosymbiont of Agriotes lineatus TaxID=3077930 RepID=UPI0030D1AD09
MLTVLILIQIFAYLTKIYASDFFKQEGVYKPKPSEDILTTYGWEIPKLESIKVSFVYLDRYQLNKPQYFINSFSAKVPPQPEKDNEKPLPTEINKNDGDYDYTQFQDKLDYLMIQRRDFDKFNYSYLYWIPIFNFFDDNFKYMSEMSVELNGFKQNSKFSLSRKNLYPPGFIEKVIFRELSFSSFGDVITIKTEHGSIVGYNEFLENGKSLWKSGPQQALEEILLIPFLDKLIIMVILSIFYAMMIN